MATMDSNSFSAERVLDALPELTKNNMDRTLDRLAKKFAYWPANAATD